ncbi:MAG: hypothetical protein IPM37_12415 [Hahellaceae bacterium]|nr:hypothetical protein [Hahellaceae bacterium]
MNKTQKQDNSVAYDTGAGSPNIHIATGHGCPACPFWSDSDEKIEYIDHYIEKRRTDSNVNNDFLDFMTPYGD